MNVKLIQVIFQNMTSTIPFYDSDKMIMYDFDIN